MFRTIALVETTEDADIDAIVGAARTMIDADPHVLRGQVVPGLRLMARTLPEASYVMILDFEDQEGWRRYGAGEAHAAFAAFVADVITRSTLAEYVVDS